MARPFVGYKGGARDYLFKKPNLMTVAQSFSMDPEEPIQDTFFNIAFNQETS